MPGLINSKTGINYTIKDKRRAHIGREPRQKFNKLVCIDNDARMHAHGEFHFGAAKEFKDAIIIQLLNPEAIVLSGPLSKTKQDVLSPIQQS
jgi:predicted NBD/HSP70 family sugar kinase